MHDGHEERITVGAVLLWLVALILPKRHHPRAVPHAEERPPHDHERTDASAKWTFVTLAGLGMFLVLSGFIPALLLPWMGHIYGRANPAQRVFQLPPEPRLQADPVRDFETRRAAELKILNSSGWVDRQHGIRRIPIEQAMQIVAQRGVGSVLPALPNANPALTTSPTSTTGMTP